MGEAVQPSGLSATDTAVRRRLEDSLEALARMVESGAFATEADTCGFEVELHLVDPLGRPRPVNPAVLAALDRQDVQAELSRMNLEFNVPARPTCGTLLRRLDEELAGTLDAVTAVAEKWGARAVAIGILPTLHATDLSAGLLSLNPRYPLLDAAMATVRGHPVRLDITGRDHLTIETESIAVQAAATSLQVHLRTVPGQFARFYNAAQAVSPALVAVAGNSPYLLGARLWHETRIPLLEQSLDVRARTTRRAGEPPRVWLGDRWAASALDLFADNVRRYPPLLPALEEEDPMVEVTNDRVPALHELRLHNGSVWRWNRPVYDVQHHHPHLRIENRVMPSGPTSTDMVANAAFFLGLVRAVADSDPPVSSVLDFRHVARDLQSAARLGLDARLHWPDGARTRTVKAERLVLDTLLPLAASGLDAWTVDRDDAEQYLAVIRARVTARRTGAEWQSATVDLLEGHGADREGALREMVRRYVANARSRAPVHLWPLGPA